MPTKIPSHLLPTRIERADYALTRYFLTVQPGITPEQVVDPDFWAHLARRLRVYDRIEVVAADGSFDLEVRVMGVDTRGLWARVRPLNLVEGKFSLTAPVGSSPDKDGYAVEWGGEHRWRIVRGQDVIDWDFADQASAVEALHRIKAEKSPIPITGPLVPRQVMPEPVKEPEPDKPAPVQEPGTPPAAPEPPAEAVAPKAPKPPAPVKPAGEAQGKPVKVA